MYLFWIHFKNENINTQWYLLTNQLIKLVSSKYMQIVIG